MNNELLFGDIHISSATNTDDIIVYQSGYDYGQCGGCPGSKLPPISWRYSSPTPILEKRGLTSTKLRDEINNINKIAEDAINPSHSPKCRYVIIGALVSFIIGFISMVVAPIISLYFIPISWLLIVIGFILCCGSICQTRIKKRTAVQQATENVRNYVEFDLNEKYQKTNGIRFSIIESEFVTVTTTNKGTSTNVLTYYHILISCVDTIDIALIVVVDNSDYGNQSLYPAPARVEEEGDNAATIK